MSAPLLATVAQLATAVDEAIADDDARAIQFLQIASGIVRGVLLQEITAHPGDVRRIRPSGDYRTAFLPELPVTAFTKLEINRCGTWVEFASTNYDVDVDAGIIEIYRDGYAAVPSVARGWRATYDHGYPDGEIPDAIVGAVLGLAGRAWELPIAVENERVGQRSIKYLMLDSGFRPEEEVGLEQFKVLRGN